MNYKTSIAILLFLILSHCAHTPLRKPSGMAADLGQLQMIKTNEKNLVSESKTTALRIRASCEIECVGELTKASVAPMTLFSPQTEYRATANGGFVPLMAARLQLLGDESCENLALIECKNRSRIADVRAVGLTSREWTAKLPLDCVKSRGFAISPYADAYVGKVDAVELRKFEVYAVQSAGDSYSEPKAFKPPEKCNHVIQAKVCYGDCMTNALGSGAKSSNDYVQTLMTPYYEGEESMEVCGDPLWLKWSKVDLSPALKEIECRRYFYQQIFRESGWMNSCSSMRASIPDCRANQFLPQKHN